MHALVVIQPFADYAKGDRITETAAMNNALEHHHNRVVRIAVADKPQAPVATQAPVLPPAQVVQQAQPAPTPAPASVKPDQTNL